MISRADNEVLQNTSETERSTQGRSIGDVRDQSAPTGFPGMSECSTKWRIPLLSVSEERMLQTIEANPAAACSEFGWRVWPVPYFIAAKFIVHAAGAGLCIEAQCCVTRQSQVDLALEMLSLDARTAGGQIDQTLQIAGFNASTPGFHGDPTLEIVRLHSAAAGAHANLTASALNRDWSRAILQLYIATGWHGDLIIDR